MPPELIAVLTAKDLPVWAFVLIIFFYVIATSKIAAKIPGALGALARSFQRRNVKAVEDHERLLSTSSEHYLKEITRLDCIIERLSGQIDDVNIRLQDVERENQKFARHLTLAVGVIQSQQDLMQSNGLNPPPIPGELHQYMEEKS